MPKKPADKTSIIGVIAGLAVVLALIIFVIYLWPGEERGPVAGAPPPAGPGPKTPTPTPSTPGPNTPSAVIDYNQLDTDAPVNRVVKKRKEAHGIEKEVDLIAREDETVRIGDVTIPMKEILDKIRLKEGEILESDLDGAPARAGGDESERLIRRMAAVDERIAELTRSRDVPRADAAPGDEPAGPEGVELKQVVIDLKQYKETLAALKEARDLLGADPPVDPSELNQRIADLESRKSELENRLEGQLPVEAYEQGENRLFGVYVVKPGDNIWNIHFQFLKAFLGSKGVSLSPMADEARENGRSSGVGKLLKFSEGRVYIYNLKERKLDVNLHLIHPLGKIVIFRFDEFFAMLDRIDSENVHHIEFDGETLWMPPPR